MGMKGWACMEFSSAETDFCRCDLCTRSLSQEVGSRDEGLGFFGFDLTSSAETDFGWLEEEQEEEGKPVHNIDPRTVAAEAGGSECCSR